MRATKSVTQSHYSEQLDNLLAECLTVTYNAIHYAEVYGIDNRRGMKEFYRTLKDIKLPSCYKVACITRACAIVKSRKKSEKRGIRVANPRPLRPALCVISGFFITMRGRLFIPLRRDQYFDIQLNRHTVIKLANRKVRSLTVTPNLLSLCYSEDVEPTPVLRVYGVDRNEKNITFGGSEKITLIDMTQVVKIRQTTREIVGSFRRNDARVRRRLASKYWRRCRNRTNSILHVATNFILESARRDQAAIAVEDLTDIRKLYRKGNGQGADYRFRLNSWPHWKAKQMIEWKASWEGLTTIQLTKSETYGSSSECSTCGEKLRIPAKVDVAHSRMMWCQSCKAWMDRDVNAALNLSSRGRLRFDRSLSRSEQEEASRSQQATPSFAALTREKGLASEAVTRNGTTTLILRVDASKLDSTARVVALAEPPGFFC